MKKILTVLAIALCSHIATAQQKENARHIDDPAKIEVQADKKGSVVDMTLDNSAIYPGTTRKISVYVPKQYDGTTPACLLVCLDGAVYYGMTTVMDNLIATGEMPVTIGVFINPGVIKDKNGNVIRYNRSNEFDKTDGTFAKFIETEVLPLAESVTLEDGRQVKLSKLASDHAITGASSGGIASFVAAWERPDLFSRVYCSVGTFVAMRGGNDLPALVRKTEPKQLRIFLQDGEKDAWNPLFGDWFEYNKLMESALNFAGYEYNYKWDRAGHSIAFGTRMFPDAMRWLWRGYPNAPVKGKSLNDCLSTVLAENEDWEIADDSIAATAFSKEESKVFPKSVKAQQVITLHNGTSYAVNDKGEIWLKPSNGKQTKLNTLPNGGDRIAIYPDASLLVQTEKASNWLISYTVNENGELENGQRFYWLHNPLNQSQEPARNLIFDTLGNLYAATSSGLQICDQNGRVRAILPYPTPEIADMTMKGDTVYVLDSNGKCWQRKLATQAHDPSDQPLTPKSQGQG